jgi:hypothetical protein
MPTPGAYRELFKRGLQTLLERNDLTASERADINHYLKLLADPSYKFGRMEYNGGNQHYASGELFLRS